MPRDLCKCIGNSNKAFFDDQKHEDDDEGSESE